MPRGSQRHLRQFSTQTHRVIILYKLDYIPFFESRILLRWFKQTYSYKARFRCEKQKVIISTVDAKQMTDWSYYGRANRLWRSLSYRKVGELTSYDQNLLLRFCYVFLFVQNLQPVNALRGAKYTSKISAIVVLIILSRACKDVW